MVSADMYTASYAKALLATSRSEDLHKPDQLRKATGLTPDDALSRCHSISAKGQRLRNCQAAATAVRQVSIASARSTRCAFC
jgi:hypothetical protein